MNTSFEKSKNSTDEWYTPKEIIDALGEFDLNPCAPMRPLWRTARVMYNKEQDGLKQKWEGRVWLNPPYSRPTIEHFITRMVEHNNGIALLFNRLDNKMLKEILSFVRKVDSAEYRDHQDFMEFLRNVAADIWVEYTEPEQRSKLFNLMNKKNENSF